MSEVKRHATGLRDSIINCYEYTDEEMRSGMIPHETWLWEKEVPVPKLSGDPTAILRVQAEAWWVRNTKLWNTSLQVGYVHRYHKKKFAEFTPGIPMNEDVFPAEVRREMLAALKEAVRWLGFQMAEVTHDG